MAKRTLPNRGYIFEAVWAAAIAARFYRRLGDFENITKTRALQKSISKRVELQTLPRISSKVFITHRCAFSGRVWSVNRKTRYSRFLFRTESYDGNIPGCRRASW